jgi:hypothetical protein
MQCQCNLSTHKEWQLQEKMGALVEPALVVLLDNTHCTGVWGCAPPPFCCALPRRLVPCCVVLCGVVVCVPYCVRRAARRQCSFPPTPIFVFARPDDPIP